MSVNPTIGISNNDDTTPPVTTHTLNPPEPDGNNGWYVSNVNVTLTATDDMSGVNITYYRIDDGEWVIYTEPFTLSEDGDDILIEYHSVDYANNVEDVKSATVDIDKTEPDISICFEIITQGHGWEYLLTATAQDLMSGMERVEFYVDRILHEIVYGPGLVYEWLYNYPGNTSKPFRVRGFIRDPVITEENVSFFAFIVRISGFPLNYWSFMVCGYDNAGNKACDQLVGSNHPDSLTSVIYLFKNLTFINNYEGYIGKFLILATFNPD